MDEILPASSTIIYSSQSSDISLRRGSFTADRKQRKAVKHVSQQVMQNNLQQESKPAHYDLLTLSDEDMIKEVEELQKTIRKLRIENLVFSRFLEANEPECLADIDTYMTQPQPQIFPKLHTIDRASRKDFASIIILATATQKEKETPKININQRSDLISKDLEGIQEKIAKIRKKADKAKRIYVAKIEEYDVTKTELEEAIDKFTKQLESPEPFTLEKFGRFMNEWSKKSRIMADKIRLRYSSLKVHLQKLSSTLAHKQLIGENVTEIDFENVRVENFHLLEEIDKKNHLLLELKRMTGAGNLKLSQHKAILIAKNREKRNLYNQNRKIDKDILKLDTESEKTGVELNEAKEKYFKIKDLVTHHKAPDIMDYIKQKLQLNISKKELKVWNRRKILTEKALKMEVEKMKQIMDCKEEHPCWFE